jgi:hypothetical protein
VSRFDLNNLSGGDHEEFGPRAPAGSWRPELQLGTRVVFSNYLYRERGQLLPRGKVPSQLSRRFDPEDEGFEFRGHGMIVGRKVMLSGTIYDATEYETYFGGKLVPGFKQERRHYVYLVATDLDCKEPFMVLADDLTVEEGCS